MKERQYIVEDRQYIEGQTIHWRTGNTLKDRQYIEEDTQYIGGHNTLKDRQYIVEDRQYIKEVRQYIVEDRQYIGGQKIHWRRDNTSSRTDNTL